MKNIFNFLVALFSYVFLLTQPIPFISQLLFYKVNIFFNFKDSAKLLLGGSGGGGDLIFTVDLQGPVSERSKKQVQRLSSCNTMS